MIGRVDGRRRGKRTSGTETGESEIKEAAIEVGQMVRTFRAIKITKSNVHQSLSRRPDFRRIFRFLGYRVCSF